jgi:hypothetical protein
MKSPSLPPFFVSHKKENAPINTPGARNGSHKSRTKNDEWTYVDMCATLFEFLEGKRTAKDLAVTQIRTIGGEERKITKMVRNYRNLKDPTSEKAQQVMRRPKHRNKKEKNRMAWGDNTHWVCPKTREGHVVSENELWWVSIRIREGVKREFFSGMTWKRLAQEVGRSPSECRNLFGHLVPVGWYWDNLR